jgi:hypothetical protein
MEQKLILKTEPEVSESKPESHRSFFFVLKSVIVGLMLFAVSTLDFAGLSLRANVIAYPLHWLGLSIASAFIVSILTVRSADVGARLIAEMSALYYTVVILLTAVETAVFFSDLPMGVIVSILVNGIFTTLTLTISSVVIHGRTRGGDPSFEKTRFSIREWVWRFIAVGIVYVLVYIFSGALIFLPLAGEATQAYSNLQMPDWILQFQMLRGAVWAAATVPILHSFRGTEWEKRITIVLAYVVFVAGLVLMPNEIMAPQVVFAHFMELAVGHSLVFGLAVVWLFSSHHKSPLARIGERRVTRLS